MSSQRPIFLILTDDGVCSQDNFTHVILQFPAHKTFVLIVCSLRGVNFLQLTLHSLQSSLLAERLSPQVLLSVALKRKIINVLLLLNTMAHFQLDTNFGDSLASTVGITVLFQRKGGRMGRERGVTVMPAKYRQGDDLLRMLARAYKSNLCTGQWGNFERQKPFTGTNNSLLVCRNENGVRKT